ncbi:MAG: DUF2062 domain-containing protein [Bacteroidota bacterium]|nr:DUF2062 domain-containing protein [Bacteroidota bacterium]
MSPLPLPADPSPPASWFRRRVLDPLLGLLKQGLAPGQLALTVALGITLGLIPLLGATTVLAALLAWRLRLNVAALQLVTHLLTPVQVLLLPLLLRQGALLLGATSGADLSLSAVRHLVATNWRAALRLLWRAELGALALWAVGGVVLGIVLYLVLKPVFTHIAARQANENVAAS